MTSQAAYHVRGATVHADADCLRNRASRVVLTGAYLPVDSYGHRPRWSPCSKCGTALVTTLATTAAADSSWMLSLHPVTEDTRSWQLTRRGPVADLLRALAAACDLRVLATDRGADPELAAAAGDVVVLGHLPAAVVAVLTPMVRSCPLPARAVTQQAQDPGRFAVTAAVFARIVAAGADVTPAAETPGEVAAVRAWAEDRWMAAEAIVTPAQALPSGVA